MNKYLFLDIDGVLNHDEWFESVHYKKHQENWKKSMFDPECVARVNKILDATGARLVVSSSWRSMTDLKEIFEGVGLPTDFDITPCADTIYSREEYDWDSPYFGEAMRSNIILTDILQVIMLFLMMTLICLMNSGTTLYILVQIG